MTKPRTTEPMRTQGVIRFEMPDDVDTVGGLAMNLFGHVPRAGEKIEHEGYAIEVLEATSIRVGRVQFARVAVEVES